VVALDEFCVRVVPKFVEEFSVLLLRVVVALLLFTVALLRVVVVVVEFVVAERV
jgi:hypothetical protein